MPPFIDRLGGTFFTGRVKLSLTVTPPVVPLGTIEVALGGRVGMGRPLANAPERTVSAAGVREYIPRAVCVGSSGWLYL